MFLVWIDYVSSLDLFGSTFISEAEKVEKGGIYLFAYSIE